MRQNDARFEPFTPKLMWQEAAPHTWPAAIIPVLLAVALCASPTAHIDVLTVNVLLAICVLMQASVNTFNDYYDYIKGADTVENSSDDASDAIFVHYNIDPKSGLAFAVGLLAAAFALGIYIIAIAGAVPFAIALVGAFIVAAYSAGKTPLSYYPVGEAVSGFVMGGLITFACVYVLSGTLDSSVLLYALPCIIGIGLIMMTNNTCDIEKDIDAHRRTLPVVLGRQRAVKAYHALLALWVSCLIVLSFVHARASGYDFADALAAGLITIPATLLIAYPTFRAIGVNPLIARTRDAAMPQILNLNVTLGLGYIVTLLMPSVFSIGWF